jgi:hypothetical protein
MEPTTRQQGHTDILRQTLDRKLMRAAGIDADPAAVAAEAIRLHEDLTACLTPILGRGGVAAMVTRSIHVAQREFLWLQQTRPSEPDRPALARLRQSLEQQPAPIASEGAAAVLASFGSLLTTFIGPGLAARLLREAWPDIVVSDSPAEKKSL